MTLSEDRVSKERMIEDRIGLGMLIAASAAVILISLVEPTWALLGFLLNALNEPLRRFLRKKKSSA